MTLPLAEDAFAFVVESLRRNHPPTIQDTTRADVDVTDLAWNYMAKYEGATQRTMQTASRERELTPPLSDALWDLCRMGVLRPGNRKFEPGPGWDGSKFSLTDFGRHWVVRPLDELVFVGPERAPQILGRYQERFGDAFLQRGVEASKCYRAGLYLACVAMCGAAREAVLVALAKEWMDGGEVESLYLTSGGRGRLEARVVGNLRTTVRDTFLGYSKSLDFWRDYAAHGRPAPVGEQEAFYAIHLLLRLAQFTDANIPVRRRTSRAKR